MEQINSIKTINALAVICNTQGFYQISIKVIYDNAQILILILILILQFIHCRLQWISVYCTLGMYE